MSDRPRELIRHRWLRRSVWEGTGTTLIALGVAMLMQPFSLALYGWSFATVLAGTVVFTIATKLPER